MRGIQIRDDVYYKLKKIKGDKSYSEILDTLINVYLNQNPIIVTCKSFDSMIKLVDTLISMGYSTEDIIQIVLREFPDLKLTRDQYEIIKKKYPYLKPYFTVE